LLNEKYQFLVLFPALTLPYNLKINDMKARVSIPQLRSENSARTVIRNLSRILDIKIVDLDIENGYLTFIYETKLAFNKVKIELTRIGYPMKNYNSTSLLEDMEIPRYSDQNESLMV